MRDPPQNNDRGLPITAIPIPTCKRKYKKQIRIYTQIVYDLRTEDYKIFNGLYLGFVRGILLSYAVDLFDNNPTI